MKKDDCSCRVYSEGRTISGQLVEFSYPVSPSELLEEEKINERIKKFLTEEILEIAPVEDKKGTTLNHGSYTKRI